MRYLFIILLFVGCAEEVHPAEDDIYTDGLQEVEVYRVEPCPDAVMTYYRFMHRLASLASLANQDVDLTPETEALRLKTEKECIVYNYGEGLNIGFHVMPVDEFLLSFRLVGP